MYDCLIRCRFSALGTGGGGPRCFLYPTVTKVFQISHIYVFYAFVWLCSRPDSHQPALMLHTVDQACGQCWMPILSLPIISFTFVLFLPQSLHCSVVYLRCCVPKQH